MAAQAPTMTMTMTMREILGIPANWRVICEKPSKKSSKPKAKAKAKPNKERSAV